MKPFCAVCKREDGVLHRQLRGVSPIWHLCDPCMDRYSEKVEKAEARFEPLVQAREPGLFDNIDD